MEQDETKINRLLKQVACLRGKTPDLEGMEYGESICRRCGGKVRAEGQEALQALAAAEGIYFRCKLQCHCGGSLGFVRIYMPGDSQDD